MKDFMMFVLICGFGLIHNLSAADAPGGPGWKLAVVDFQKALNSVEEGKSAKAKLKKEFDDKQKELDTRKTKLDKLQTEIEGLQKQVQSGLVKPDQQAGIMEKGRKLEMDFRKQLEEFTELGKKHQQELGEKEMKATQEILNRLKSIVQDMGRTDGYNLVLEQNASGLVYAAAYTDLTERLIQKYNAQYKAKN